MRGCRFGSDRLAWLSEVETWHFWFVGRRALIDRLLNRYLRDKTQPILDLGCGTGLLSRVMMARGYRMLGLDLRPEGLSVAHKALPQLWLVQAEATRPPLRQNVLGAVMLLDVLEHVDDQIALAEVKRVLLPGGRAVITVPAMPWLWSNRDERAGHLRRYSRKQLSRALADAGLQVEELRYYQCLLFPLVVITRLFGRRGQGACELEERPLPIFNRAMMWITKLEVRLSDIIPWPWGSSLVVIARKQ